MKLFVFLLILGMAGGACMERRNPNVPEERRIVYDTVRVTVDTVINLVEGLPEESVVEKQMRGMGFVDIAEIDPSIAVRMVYATPYNFVGKVLYRDIHRAFMLPEMAAKLADAQKRLKKIRPDLNIIVYDAARPMSVQQELWNVVRGTELTKFVSNPAKGGGLHNYGAAVDVSLMDCTGATLEMGSRYDYFGDEARIDAEEELLREGRITRRELNNRHLLRKVMKEAGFRTIKNEWWHFNLLSREEAVERLQVIE